MSVRANARTTSLQKGIGTVQVHQIGYFCQDQRTIVTINPHSDCARHRDHAMHEATARTAPQQSVGLKRKQSPRIDNRSFIFTSINIVRCTPTHHEAHERMAMEGYETIHVVCTRKLSEPSCHFNWHGEVDDLGSLLAAFIIREFLNPPRTDLQANNSFVHDFFTSRPFYKGGLVHQPAYQTRIQSTHPHSFPFGFSGD